MCNETGSHTHIREIPGFSLSLVLTRRRPPCEKKKHNNTVSSSSCVNRSESELEVKNERGKLDIMQIKSTLVLFTFFFLNNFVYQSSFHFQNFTTCHQYQWLYRIGLVWKIITYFYATCVFEIKFSHAFLHVVWSCVLIILWAVN